MKKILIFGDITTAKWHPLGGVDDEIKEIIGDKYEVEVSEDYNILLKLNDYDLLILYKDKWEIGENSEEIIASIITYVANGSPILTMHASVVINDYPELIQIFGAKFKSHPKINDITVKAIDKNDPITKDLEDFVTFEEPYTYIMDEVSNITVLTEFVYDGQTFINSWKKKFGKGEVVYLMNGHTPKQFKDEGNRILVKNAVEYLLR
ncbi:MAG: ThuA domain-containing protein [Clostridia bacterium]